MNDDGMNDDFEIVADEAQEARIVAVILGEASDFEGEEVARLCAENPELQIFRRRMEAVHGLLGDSANPAPAPAPNSGATSWKLSGKKREEILSRLGEKERVAPGPRRKRSLSRETTRTLIQIAACAAVAALLIGLALPTQMKSRMLGQALPEGLIAESPSIVTYHAGLDRQEELQPSAVRADAPSAPSTSMARVIASNTASPTAIPVPKPATRTSQRNFGDGDDFGEGWGNGKDRAMERELAVSQLEEVNSAHAFDSSVASFSAMDASPKDAGGGGAGAFGFAAVDATEPAQPLKVDRMADSPPDPFAASGDSLDKASSDFQAVEPKDGSGLAWLKTEVTKQQLRLENAERAKALSGGELVELATEMHDYREASRDYESNLELLQQLKLKHSSERVALRSSDASMETHKPAQLEGLREEIERQKGQVENKRKVLDTIVRINGRPYFEGTKNSPESTERQLRMTAEKNAFEMRKNKDQYKIHLDKLEQLEEEQLLRYAAELPVENNSVRSLHAEFLQTTRKLQVLRTNGLGEAHPSFQTLKERQEGLQKDIHKAVAILKASLKTNLELLTEQLSVLERTDSNGESKEMLERRIQNERDKLEALKKKLADEAAKRKSAQNEALDEKDAATEGDSTFSLHVSDVSFKLAKAALEQGRWPETVRVEEFVNAFSYRERALAPNERIGIAMEQAAHPFLSQRNLLRVSLQTAATGRGAGVPLRLTVVLDKSGSMERIDRTRAVEEAFRVLIEQLNPGDKVTLVGFSRQPTLLADFVDGSEGEKLLKILRETPSEGGTNVEEALRLAENKAMEHYLAGAQNRVILLTDGIANLGDAVPESLMTLVEEMREQGLAFDACGVGVEGINDDILEALTRKGDGRYYLLGSTEESGADFAKQVAGALRPAAQNVKVQLEWNPDRVGQWRLYGFEKHELKKEDFRNDAVDAAELAAEEEGVALYHVEVKPDGDGPLGVARVRFLDVASGEMVEREWEIAYEGESVPLSEADPRMKLAGVAGLTAEKLARSAVGQRVDWDDLLETVRPLKGAFATEARVKELEWMIEKAKELE